VFLWVYLTAAMLLAFVLLPLLIHWTTPFSYREVLSVAGEAVITALATGTVLVVLPMIIERCKEMLTKHDMDCEETMSTVDVLVPTAYSFPSVGTLLGLGFVLFSAWYVGTPLSLDQYPSFVVMGAFTAFGSMAVAIPFMLDFFSLPADQFQLYLLGSVVTGRVATGLAALHGFVVTLLVASAVLQRLKWTRFMQVIGLHLGITAGVMMFLGLALTYLIPYEYTGVRTFESMYLMNEPAAAAEIKEPLPLSANDQTLPRLEVIRERGSIRVGYFSNTLPYVFNNENGNIVGFDAEMLHQLANDLNLTLEFTRINDFDAESHMLLDGRVDIIVGGRAITPVRALDVAFSDSYTYHSVGLMVTDDKADEFADMDMINAMTELKLGYLSNPYYMKAVREMFPQATLTAVQNPRTFFRGNHDHLDAYVYSAEAGSAWCMLYPEYSSIIPRGLTLKAPVGFKLPRGQLDYVQFINTWLNLKEENGFQQDVYNYWILGQNPQAKKQRGSVLHNVLGF